MRRYKACIITPDIVGPVKNGGIGTHCFYLARFLVEQMSQDVTVVHTGSVEVENIRFWRRYYKSKFNIQFIHESELPLMFNGEMRGGRWFLLRSQRIYNWLKEQDFDICYFQDWHANGFVSIQAKQTGQAFHNTIVTCMAHSSTEWIREGMQLFPCYRLDDLTLDYMERYCMQYADYALSPSEYMFKWAESHDWTLSNNRVVLPYLFESTQNPIKTSFTGEHIIFFGRLETRKGFEVFLHALQLLAPQLKQSKKTLKVSFLGKKGLTSYGSPEQAIKKCLKKYSDVYKYSILNEMSHSQALDFLVKNSSALVVIPSLVDNLPYTVLECVELNLNVIAAKTGGIPEIFGDESRLFTPIPKNLASKLEECITHGIGPITSKYSSENSKFLWKEFCNTVAGTDVSKINCTNLSSSNQELLVSVCIPYYNYGEYLPHLLKSLDKQTYNNFEAVVVNDGSTDDFSRRVFAEMKEKYQHKNWLFVEKENGGIGNTRNLAASKSSGDYLVFMDADNAAEPQMLEKMVKGILSSKVDCLTCYFRAFDSEISPFAKVYAYSYAPLGGCIEAGAYENIFGDANFIIKREAFFNIGGFKEDRDTSYEDWEFLARLTISGYTLDVIPDFLFLYRHTEDGFSRTTSTYKNHHRVLRAYIENAPFWTRRLLVNSVGCTTGIFSQVELERYKQRVEAMETSKFWKMRKAWFKVKRAMGLTDESETWR
ncbi:MAG: glycosyltransferase [Fischerella sp.]|uniref:glycosyltransferase n=1 Tax=Fischerella sp. TaxID=1191 RepID=UPI0017C47A9B|nr:glycosyltransferase [Fischerella sp.]NWF59127.1 glycosyltransferase [Fischerella sp.]